MLNHEAKLLAKTGAVIGLCPVTEANLGDGIFKIMGKVLKNLNFTIGRNLIESKFGIGTEMSNVKISLFFLKNWLKMVTLEYSQRLKYRKRDIVLKQKNSLSIGRDLIETILHDQ